MRISRIDLAYYIFAILALIFSLYTIVFHLGFVILPLGFFFTGLIISFFPKERGLKIFFILIPLINSLPALFFNGYPFNLMATILFLLSGLIIGSILKGPLPTFKDFRWAKSFLFFLTVLWISAFFVFLRWSNITTSFTTFFADTPVGPGLPQSPRVSFAIIFPVITLFLFSVTPFIASLIRMHSLRSDLIFKLIISGYSFSVLIALYQKFFDNGFLSIAWWGEKMNQYNGGFSDFNGFGFFGGMLFLYASLNMMNSSDGISRRRSAGRIPFFVSAAIISLIGIIISGSRTAFIFVIFAFIFLMFSKLKRSVKIFIPVFFIIILLLSGGVLLKRLEKTFNTARTADKDLVSVIDDLSNGRVQMISHSIPIIRGYPVSGIGAGNFLFHLKSVKYGETFLEDLPLNQYLLFMDELGIVGLLSFLFFVFIVLKWAKKDLYYRIFVVFLLVMVVGNSLWLPEIMILFWVIAASMNGADRSESFTSGKFKPIPYLVLAVFACGNILTFNSLHPSNLMHARGLPYDYGLWSESVNAGFNWTKHKSGILIRMDNTGGHRPVIFFCGAPLEKLPGKSQILKIFRNGKLLKTRKFTANEAYILQISGKPNEKIFLEMEVSPVFNLKKMGLGLESRDLGIQFRSESSGL